MCMRFAASVSRNCRQFLSDREGSILPTFAILLVLIIVAAGAGIDYGRAIFVKTKISGALDNALVFAAQQLSSGKIRRAEVALVMNREFNANLQKLGVSDVTLDRLNPTVTDGTISATASGEVKTMFVFLGGIGPSELTFGSQNEVSYGGGDGPDIELALILDTTGSMYYYMDDLKDAANDLVDTLIPDRNKEENVRISLIPYSAGVNLGGYASRVVSVKKSLRVRGTLRALNERNCVTERVGNQQFSDATYDYSLAEENYFGGGSVSGNGREAGCPDGAVFLPLTSNKRKIKREITQMYASGGTFIQTGVAWGWYSLSPNWSNLWPRKSKPSAYGEKDKKKIAVIMTDGQNSGYHDLKRYDGYQCDNQNKYVWNHKSGQYWLRTLNSEYLNCPLTFRWKRIRNYWFPVYGDSLEADRRTRKLCENMAEKGIQVNTVFFDTSGDGIGRQLMENCVSEDGKFYYAESAGELSEAFKNIAGGVKSLYLSK